ncbi:APC membrane recruitment protein 2 [Merluccius polli]|uniref:APC membrane recruitment protein 2 n=1 Tax=Merluccius polli TaxID=89951 RepID=A0AA47P7F2_MERPO|nr:APC membrane recruitment protein 2 [Merluccius polli]
MDVQSDTTDPPSSESQPSGKKKGFKLFGKRKPGSIFSIRGRGEEKDHTARSKAPEGSPESAPPDPEQEPETENPPEVRGLGENGPADEGMMMMMAAAPPRHSICSTSSAMSLSFLSRLRGGRKGGRGERQVQTVSQPSAGRQRRGIKGLFSNVKFPQNKHNKEDKVEVPPSPLLMPSRSNSVEIIKEDMTLTPRPPPRAHDSSSESEGPQPESHGRSSGAISGAPVSPSASTPLEPGDTSLSSLLADISSLLTFDSITTGGDIMADVAAEWDKASAAISARDTEETPVTAAPSSTPVRSAPVTHPFKPPSAVVSVSPAPGSSTFITVRTSSAAQRSTATPSSTLVTLTSFSTPPVMTSSLITTKQPSPYPTSTATPPKPAPIAPIKPPHSRPLTLSSTTVKPTSEAAVLAGAPAREPVRAAPTPLSIDKAAPVAYSPPSTLPFTPSDKLDSRNAPSYQSSSAKQPPYVLSNVTTGESKASVSVACPIQAKLTSFSPVVVSKTATLPPTPLPSLPASTAILAKPPCAQDLVTADRKAPSIASSFSSTPTPISSTKAPSVPAPVPNAAPIPPAYKPAAAPAHLDKTPSVPASTLSSTPRTPAPASTPPNLAPMGPTPAPDTPTPASKTPTPSSFTPTSITPAPSSLLKPHPFPYPHPPITPTPSSVTPTPVPMTCTPASKTPTPSLAIPMTCTPASKPPIPASVIPTPITPTPSSVTPTPATMTCTPASKPPIPASVIPTPITPTPASVTPTPASMTCTPASKPPIPASVIPTPITPTPASVTRTADPVVAKPAPTTPISVSPPTTTITPGPGRVQASVPASLAGTNDKAGQIKPAKREETGPATAESQQTSLPGPVKDRRTPPGKLVGLSKIPVVGGGRAGKLPVRDSHPPTHEVDGNKSPNSPTPAPTPAPTPEDERPRLSPQDGGGRVVAGVPAPKQPHHHHHQPQEESQLAQQPQHPQPPRAAAGSLRDSKIPVMHGAPPTSQQPPRSKIPTSKVPVRRLGASKPAAASATTQMRKWNIRPGSRLISVMGKLVDATQQRPCFLLGARGVRGRGGAGLHSTTRVGGSIRWWLWLRLAGEGTMWPPGARLHSVTADHIRGGEVWAGQKFVFDSQLKCCVFDAQAKRCVLDSQLKSCKFDSQLKGCMFDSQAKGLTNPRGLART